MISVIITTKSFIKICKIMPSHLILELVGDS
jgi:hypothetical protein